MYGGIELAESYGHTLTLYVPAGTPVAVSYVTASGLVRVSELNFWPVGVVRLSTMSFVARAAEATTTTDFWPVGTAKV